MDPRTHYAVALWTTVNLNGTYKILMFENWVHPQTSHVDLVPNAIAGNKNSQ